LKSALAATALTLYGVIPTHIHYDAPNQKALQDWLWSVGDSPFSYTSQEAHFSTFHKDNAYRNQIIVSLEYSIDQINDGVEVLSTLKTSACYLSLKLGGGESWLTQRIGAEPTNAQGKDKLPIEKALEAYNATRTGWEEVIVAVERLDWQKATSMLKQIETDAHACEEMGTNDCVICGAYPCYLGLDKFVDTFRKC